VTALLVRRQNHDLICAHTQPTPNHKHEYKQQMVSRTPHTKQHTAHILRRSTSSEGADASTTALALEPAEAEAEAEATGEVGGWAVRRVRPTALRGVCVLLAAAAEWWEGEEAAEDVVSTGKRAQSTAVKPTAR
jgi:hypothetical protein